jgi:choline dehydrogenase-like flavoprotein
MSEIQRSGKVDVLVIGSGAAGSVFAAKAAKAGKRVLILEAGPERDLNSLTSSQIWARKLKWSGSFVEERGNHKVGNVFNSGYGTGGSAIHHYGVWPRLHENDFNTKSLYGVGSNWPIDYPELQQYYDQIQDEVGISGDHKQEKWRPKGRPYPMPPLPVLRQGRAIAKGFSAQGLHTAPIPMAVRSTPSTDRQACLLDGWCDAGCPNGALANPLVTYLAEAKSHGSEIIHQATVSKILCNDKGNKVIGVEYIDALGQLKVQHADSVILAAFAVQSPRLLLLSSNKHHPNGLGNNHDLVGRYFMTHPTHSIWGLFPEETMPHMGLNGGQLINQDNYDNKHHKNNSYGSYQWLIGNAVKPNDLLGIANSRPDIFGKKLKPFLNHATKHIGNMVGICDDIPQAENRVTLSSNKDKHGLPLAEVTHNIHSRTETLTQQMIQEGLSVFKSAGVKEPWAGPRAGMHLMGGTKMGDAPENSVTNQFGQVHGVDNLFIAGPGLFPTSGAVNPTYTVHAISLMAVEHMLKHWESIVA